MNKEEIKKYEIGNEIKYKNLKWFVTKVNDNSITLMLADKMSNNLIDDIFDKEMIDVDHDIRFDKDSYDWKESYIREILNNDFLKKLDIDKNDLVEMKINYAEDEYITDFVRIPTLKECRELPKTILERNGIWSFYVMNKGVYRKDIDEYNHGFAAGVFAFGREHGHADTYISFRVVRPVITVKREVIG